MKVQMTVVMASLFAAVASATLEMPMIISHRGESKERPENSMAAYRLAFERGVDGVECDVYATTDGRGVLIHDATTGRTAGSANNLTVTSCSWDDLKNIAIGNFSPWAGGEYAGPPVGRNLRSRPAARRQALGCRRLRAERACGSFRRHHKNKTVLRLVRIMV